MSSCVSTAVDMLKSKVASDVFESLEFLCSAKHFNVGGADAAISKCLSLVWSQDERLQKAVLSVYVRLYLTGSGQREDNSNEVVRNLLEIMSHSTVGELASFDKLIRLMVSSGHLPDSALKQLWHTYHSKRNGLEALLACQLLSMSLPASTSASGIRDHVMSSGLAAQSKGEYYK